MSFRFPDSSPAPSTPERRSTRNFSAFGYDSEHPSTTPAGHPPPSSAPSFTPAGDPSPSYLKSSIGAMSGKVKPLNFNKSNLGSSLKSSSGRSGGAPLASSIRASTTRRPSRLSRQYYAEDDDDEDDDDEDDDEEDEQELPPNPSGTYSMPMDDTIETIDDVEGDSEDEEAEYEENEENVEVMMQDKVEHDIEADLLREIAGTANTGREPGPYGDRFDEDDSDIMMTATPAVDERIRKDAERLFRMSSMPKKKEFKYATLAKDLISQRDITEVSEPDNILHQTEDIINRLYDEGVGPKDDREKLSHTLSQACIKLVDEVWGPYVDSLPRASEEHAAKVGPPAHAPDFEKARYVATLMLRIHHTPPDRSEFGGFRYPALPSVLFNWQDDQHNLDRDQMEVILRHRPSPACHSLFWQGAFSSLVRGNIETTIHLLRGAGWESIKKSPRSEPLYKGQILENIRLVVGDLCKVMELCPALNNDSWDIRSSDWTLFRLKAKAAKERLIDFAEGKDRHLASSRFNMSEFASSIDSRRSITGLARKAESQIPWEIYESLQSLYSILTGDAESILAAAQDWCEATIALLGWWNEEHNKRTIDKPRPRAGVDYTESSADEYFLDRLASCFYTAMESEFHFASNDPVEAAVVCAFEDNVEGVIGFLRLWSLPVSSAVAEIAALGGWLIPPEAQNLISMDSLDMEDLEILGMSRNTGPDEKDGIKDATLIHYARKIRDRQIISGNISRGKVSMEGWEMAVQVVGRIDSAERSEEMVRDLLQSVLSKINEDSHATVDKIWRLLNELGMINFAEDTVEVSVSFILLRFQMSLLTNFRLSETFSQERHSVLGKPSGTMPFRIVPGRSEMS